MLALWCLVCVSPLDAYRRFDFIDAVLEEGALPTLPVWCDVSRHIRTITSGDSEDEGMMIDDDDEDDDDDNKHNTNSNRTSSSVPVGTSVDAVSSTSSVLFNAALPTVSLWRADGDSVDKFTPVAVKVLTTLDIPASTALQFARDVSKGHLALFPPSHWKVPIGQCSGTLAMLIEACLNRFALVYPLAPCVNPRS